MANTPSPAFGMLDSFTSSPGGKVISDLFDLCFFTGACKKDNKISFVNHISPNTKQNLLHTNIFEQCGYLIKNQTSLCFLTITIYTSKICSSM